MKYLGAKLYHDSSPPFSNGHFTNGPKNFIVMVYVMKLRSQMNTCNSFLKFDYEKQLMRHLFCKSWIFQHKGMIIK